jgi:hypothetical protein
MKIWLDDIRPAPNGWIHIKTAEKCIEMIQSGNVKEISFDYDLGETLTGYDVAKYIEENANKIPPIIWELHTSNVIGMKNMYFVLTHADKIWLTKQNNPV